ncbi:MAG TPA: zf-HC2 domain-containing protein [Verrucomicrobiae bacterium]|nr:zf-HC2 domain-containing protein [Verrucomicrobiae bacterium]
MVNGDGISCEQMWHEISNYLDGEVDASLRAAMDAHFQQCRRCRSLLEGMQNVIRLYGDERMMEVPAGFGKRLERRLAEATKECSRGWSTWSAWLVPVAALLLIAGGVRLANSLTTAHSLKSAHAQPGHAIPPDMMVVVTAHAKVFHVATCPFIHNKDTERMMTAQEAIREGYVPCLRCMRKYLDTASLGKSGPAADADADADADDVPDSQGQ